MLNRFMVMLSTLGFGSIALAEDAGVIGGFFASQGSSMSSMLMITSMFVMFYFLMIRPQNKRQKEHRDLLSNLTVGDEVVTTGGIAGKITRVTDNFLLVTISEGVEVAVQKHAITVALPKGTIKAL